MDRYPSLSAYVASQSTHGVDQPLPMRYSWGPRYNPAEDKMTAPDQKGVGFYGPMQTGRGDNIAGEIGRTDMINGQLRNYPTFYQGMPQDQRGAMLMYARMMPMGPQLGPVQRQNLPVPQSIDDAAYAAAKSRVNAGRSPFFEQGKDPYPAWSPDQFWEAPYGMK